MHLTISRLREAEQYLRDVDPVMSGLIAVWGPCDLRRQRNRFGMLARSIISQQISTKAARSIQRRLLEQIDGQWAADRLDALGID
ncbi:MAG: hypothetical protein ABGZ17_26035, partial [Planctomycetaceae bacterium]